MQSRLTVPSTLLLLFGFCSLSALSADSLDEGRSLYAQGKYAQAAGLLNSYVVGHPEDAAAQYYLGCSYVGLHRNEEAIDHYQQAIKLAPKSTIASYSRNEVTKLKVFAPSDSDLLDAVTSSIKLSTPKVVPASTPMSKSDALTAVHNVNQQTDESEKKLQDEYAAKIKQVSDDAKVRIDRINQSKQEALSELGPAWRTRNGGYWTPDASPINADYKQKIDQVNKETERKIAELNLECKSRINELEQFAVGSSRAYSGHELTGSSRSNPASSNLHVHNYEIDGDVSGNATPLIASPQKLPPAKSTAR